MRRRDQWLQWIRSVEREGELIAVALVVLEDRLRQDPSVLRQHGLERADFSAGMLNREGTYVIRVYAEFESGLREAWERAFGETTHPKAVDLLHAFASRCRVPPQRLGDVDRVRIFRNHLVHAYDEATEKIPLSHVRRYLCRFLSHLPEDW
ncbi:MAG: hypothetical protein MUE50_27375 [Pirellulaceae bacterium]|jgi:hypothetical protein|nr:hypothetical protein [Pirellulaceae bacterium]